MLKISPITALWIIIALIFAGMLKKFIPIPLPKEGFFLPPQGSLPLNANSLPPEIWQRIYYSTVGELDQRPFECGDCHGVLNR